MFNSPILDIAISLAFTYLLLAIIASSINEWILNSVLNTRANDLKKALENLLFDPEWKVIAQKIFDSPFIKTLQSEAGKFPSYIPSRSFAAAFTQVIKDDVSAPEGTFDLASVKNNLLNSKVLGGDARKLISGIIDQAENKVDKFQDGLINLYNDAMDRASGWYKRRTKRVLFIIAIVVSFTLNIDTIQVTKTLWAQPQLAKASADYAASHIGLIDTTGGNFSIKPDKTKTTDTTVVIQKRSAAVDSSFTIKNQQIQNINSANNILSGLPLPLGWVAGNYPNSEDGKLDFLGWLSKLFGLMLTAGAISLGAPFWFDVANKFINIRMSGKKPEDDGSSKKKKKQ